jgi:hypothetical protein
MRSFRVALQVLNAMKDEGVIEDYAIAGAIALAFWTEPVATYDRVRVVRPEYLVALYLQPGARTAKRRECAAALLEWPGLNRAALNEILSRHGLSF